MRPPATSGCGWVRLRGPMDPVWQKERNGNGDGDLQRCDFCGRQVPQVRRIALDRDYDRLHKPHRERYACADCSERKERVRLDQQRG